MLNKIFNIFNNDNLDKIIGLDEEQKRFLSDNAKVSENKRIEFIIKYIFNNCFQEVIDGKKETLCVEYIEELIDINSISDNSNYIIKLGGINMFFALLFYCNSDKILSKIYSLLVDISNNNISVQNQLLRSGFFKILLLLKDNIEKNNVKLIEKNVKLIYSVIKGINLRSKREFYKSNGHEYLIKILASSYNTNITQKVYNLLIDLLKVDPIIKYDLEINNKEEVEIIKTCQIRYNFLDYFLTKKIFYNFERFIFNFEKIFFYNDLKMIVIQNLYILCLKNLVINLKNIYFRIKKTTVSELISKLESKLSHINNDSDDQIITLRDNITELITLLKNN